MTTDFEFEIFFPPFFYVIAMDVRVCVAHINRFPMNEIHERNDEKMKPNELMKFEMQLNARERQSCNIGVTLSAVLMMIRGYQCCLRLRYYSTQNNDEPSVKVSASQF